MFFSLTDVSFISVLLMSLKVYIRIVHTSEEVDCDMDLKLDGDLIDVLGLQTNVTVLKVNMKVRVWNI